MARARRRARGSRGVAPDPADEQRVDLHLFWRDGALSFHAGRGRRLPALFTGRTDSARGLGFTFTHGTKVVRFVLDREQIMALRRYLDAQARRVRKDTRVGAPPTKRRGQSRSIAPISKLSAGSSRRSGRG